ncbi:MAG: metal ABC transporter ATP-binding protein [Rhodospirillales bacterium]|nr:metal ABC transporter ATP-binding protein [Rhodospirillales bacterium]
MKKTLSALAVSSFLLIGCASHSENVTPQYVSPVEYENYSCKQIREEISRVSARVNEVAGIQDKEADKDAAAMGVGLVLFWPALFFLIGDDQKEELARLKGEYEALEQTAQQKNCDIAKEIDAARKMEEERKSSREETVKSKGLNE